MNTSNNSKNSKVKKHLLVALAITFLVSVLLITLTCVECVSALQNSNNPSPAQCAGADWYIGSPETSICTGSVTTLGSLTDDPKTILITGNTNRLRPDLATLNKYCQQYTGEALSYASYGRVHNFCTGCDQRLAWFENNQWTSQAVCAPTLNVQIVKCATGCKPNAVCSTSSECNDDNAYTYDQCLNPGTAQSSCSHSRIACLTNNDCGYSGFFGNEFCSNNDVFKFYRESKCNNAGTVQSSCTVLETPQFIIECGEGVCQNYGVNYCKNNNVYHSRLCNNKGCASGACYTNYTTQETVVQTCNHGCANGVCLPECTDNSQCSGNQICSNNQCVNITCKCNLDCDDGKASTVDKCNYPGTVNSFCTHDLVRCNANSDCGTNGFVGNLFCQNSNVFQNYITYTCANAGTSSSTCTNSTSAQLKLTCAAGKTCSNGQCLNVVCNNDSDCNDNNSSTLDKCNNPGTSSSSCSHTVIPVVNITCSTNSNCGTNGYLNQLFCKNNNVFDKYVTYTCNNPGTSSSSCSNLTEEKAVKTCDSGCANGQCLTSCTTNSDCDSDYSEKICANKNVYTESHDFSCVQGKCVDDSNSVLVSKCRYSCDNGKCTNEDKGNGVAPIEEDSIETVLISGGDNSLYLGSGNLSVRSNYTLEKTSQKITAANVKAITGNYFWLILLIALIIILIIIILLVMFSL